MSHLQLFDKFAKLVFTFSPEIDNQIALKFSELTSACAVSSETNTFAYCESNTWKLVSIVARAKNMSDLTYASLLKQWVANVPNTENVKQIEEQPSNGTVPSPEPVSSDEPEPVLSEGTVPSDEPETKRQKTVTNNASSSPSNITPKHKMKGKYVKENRSSLNSKYVKAMQDKADAPKSTTATDVNIDDRNSNAGAISETSTSKEDTKNEKPQLGKRRRSIESNNSEPPQKQEVTEDQLVVSKDNVNIPEISNDKEDTKIEKPQLGKRHRPIESTSSDKSQKQEVTEDHLVVSKDNVNILENSTDEEDTENEKPRLVKKHRFIKNNNGKQSQKQEVAVTHLVVKDNVNIPETSTDKEDMENEKPRLVKKRRPIESTSSERPQKQEVTEAKLADKDNANILETSIVKEDTKNEKLQLGKRRRSIESTSNEQLQKQEVTEAHLVDKDSVEMEEAFKQQLYKLRYNDFIPISSTLESHQTHCQLYNDYCEYQKHALMNPSFKVPTQLRALWKQAVKDELQKSGNHKYRRALYEVLAGNEDFLNAHFCNTWEDIMWINLNKKLEDMLDDPEKNGDEPILPSDTILSALFQDRVLPRDDPRAIFHQIQAAIISGNTEQIFERVYKTIYVKNYKNPLNISEDKTFRAHLLRFLSTLIIYGTQFLGWQESKYSAALLNAYLFFNSKQEDIRPHVVAAYVSKRGKIKQKHIFSNMLQNYRGDDEQCEALINIGEQYKFDMKEILKYTFIQLFVKEKSRGGADVGEFIRALQWVTYGKDMAGDAVACAKTLVDYAIRYSKLDIIDQVNATLASAHIEGQFTMTT